MTDQRDWADSDYVRLYQAVRDDEKLGPVYADDRLWAAYTRLLMDVEAAWPVRPSLPAWLAPEVRDDLAGRGVLILSGLTYTLSGVAKERESRERRYYAGGRGRPRYPSDPPAEPVPAQPESSRSEPESPVVDSESTRAGATRPRPSAESRPLEHGEDAGRPRAHVRAGLPAEVVDHLEERVGRRFRYRPDDRVAETLAANLRQFGPLAVLASIQAIDEPHPDFAQLVFGSDRYLHPITAPPVREPDPDYVREQLKSRKAAQNGANGAHPR